VDVFPRKADFHDVAQMMAEELGFDGFSGPGA